jgi:hypothetical protein
MPISTAPAKASAMPFPRHLQIHQIVPQIDFCVFFCPYCHHRIKRPGARYGDIPFGVSSEAAGSGFSPQALVIKTRIIIAKTITESLMVCSLEPPD